MCIGAWSLLGYVKISDLTDVTGDPEDDGDETEDEVHDGWDAVSGGL